MWSIKYVMHSISSNRVSENIYDNITITLQIELHAYHYEWDGQNKFK